MFTGFIHRFAIGHHCAIGGDGLSVAVKDTVDVAGLPTRAGSRSLEDALPASRHAAVVQAMLDAGCRIVGKTGLHEFAFGMTGVSAWEGTPVNPRLPALIPGGSSSGSAAVVAAGLADVALGTDTGGSVRLPAACCGIYGFKPTFGRVDRRASALVRPFNMSGHPALSIPLPAVDGCPVGLQLVGRKGEDEAVCAIGRRIAPLVASP